MPIRSYLVAGIVVLAVISALFFYGRYEHAKAADLQHQLTQALAVNEHNAGVMKQMQAQYEASVEAGTAYAADDQYRKDQLDRIKKELSHANPHTPVSPAVRHVLGELLRP